MNMEYRILFVRFIKEGSYVRVLLDLNYLTSFISEATSQKDFEKDCEAFTKTEAYEKAYKEATGGNV